MPLDLLATVSPFDVELGVVEADVWPKDGLGEVGGRTVERKRRKRGIEIDWRVDAPQARLVGTVSRLGIEPSIAWLGGA